MKKCPHCSEQMQDDASVCPHCQRDYKPKPKISSGAMGCLVIMGFLALIFFASLVKNAVDDNASNPPAQPAKPLTPAELAKKAEADKAAAAASAKAEAAYFKTKAGQVCKKHPGWPRDVCQTISERKIRIGMTAEMVRAGWGNPDHINRTTSARGRSEQWVYGSGSYVYLEEGIVTTIQN